MFYRILVAVNNSPVSEKVFEEALFFAKATGAHLMLVNVISQFDENYLNTVEVNRTNLHPVYAQNMDYHLQSWETLTQTGLNYLYKLCQKATDLGVSVEVTQNIGDPGQVICELAYNWDADLVMVGHRSRSGFGEVFLGNVSNYVLNHASCSVLVIHGELAKVHVKPVLPVNEFVRK